MPKDLEARFKEFIQQLNMQFSTAEELMDIIVQNQEERAVKKEQFLRTYAPRLPLRPSSALACGRKLSYELFNFKKPGTFPTQPMTIRQERVFKAGDVFEEFELNRLSDYHGLDITHRQQALDVHTIDGNQIRGAIDAILWKGGRAEKKPYLLDIKTTTTYKYKSIVDQVNPKMENVAQLTLYALSPGYNQLMESEGVDKDWRRCALFYVNKDSLEYHMIEFDPNIELYNALLDRFARIYEAFKAGNLSPRDYVKADRYPCGKYCSFYQYCQGEADPELNLKVPKSFNFTGDEGTDLYNLWHKVGASSTYVTEEGKTIKVVPGKTKWIMDVKDEVPKKTIKKKRAPKARKK